MQPLSGLLVLDFSTLLPGPLASLMLAEAGAEVIKIERPGGEEMRSFAPMWEGESAAFGLLNRLLDDFAALLLQIVHAVTGKRGRQPGGHDGRIVHRLTGLGIQGGRNNHQAVAG